MSSGVDAYAYLKEAIDSGALRRGVARHEFGDSQNRAKLALEDFNSDCGSLAGAGGVAAEAVPVLSADEREKLRAGVEAMKLVASRLRTAFETRQHLEALPSELSKQSVGIRHQVLDVLKSGWQLALAARFGNLGRLGALLDRLGGFDGCGEELHSIFVAQAHLASSFPPNEEQRAAVKDLDARRSKALDVLLGGSRGAELLGFLQKTADEVATLADVTSEILDWLKEREALGAFDVKLRPTD